MISDLGCADGEGGRLEGCLMLALIVDMLDLFVLYLVALLLFLAIGCGSQHVL